MSNKKPTARHLNKVDRKKFLLATGRCPNCEINLHSKYHTNCPWLLTAEGKHVMHSKKSL
jgi:hypothetical protein